MLRSMTTEGTRKGRKEAIVKVKDEVTRGKLAEGDK
jgi:hypothetical protein